MNILKSSLYRKIAHVLIFTYIFPLEHIAGALSYLMFGYNQESIIITII